MQKTYDGLAKLTDGFFRDYLNDEYGDLARAMAAGFCRKRPSLLASGQPRAWACGIIDALKQLNFLSDEASQPFIDPSSLWWTPLIRSGGSWKVDDEQDAAGVRARV